MALIQKLKDFLAQHGFGGAKAEESQEEGTFASFQDLVLQRKYGASLLFSGRKKVYTSFSGGYRSAFRGRGMEFDQVRVYQAGDDIRTIDWRVTARRGGSPYTKLFHEERERPIFIAADLRAPMRFGTRGAFKSVIAARAAAAIAWGGLELGDKIGGIVLTPTRYARFSPHRSRKRVLGMVRVLAEGTTGAAPASKATLGDVFKEMNLVAKAGSLLFVLSDFHDFTEEAGRHLKDLAEKGDIVFIRVLDVLEKAPPPEGRYLVTDGTDTLPLYADDPTWRQTYVEYFEHKRKRLEAFCARHRIALVDLRTDDVIADVLREGFYRRARTSLK